MQATLAHHLQRIVIAKVPIQRQLKEEFGFQTVAAGVRSQFSIRGKEDESNMLTGDLNAASVEWVVQYRINDPEKYLHEVRDRSDTIRDVYEAVMRRVVPPLTSTSAMTLGWNPRSWTSTVYTPAGRSDARRSLYVQRIYSSFGGDMTQ